MSIRYTLLVSYLLISLASASLVSLMVFIHLQELLRTEIDNRLKSQAAAIMQQIDTALFERFENMALWSQLEIMQEVRVRDVDKRLSFFLSELRAGYGGVYEQLFADNSQGETVAASDSSLLGQVFPRGGTWLAVAHKNQTHTLEYLGNPKQLYYATAIPDAFKDGELGRLYASFSWRELVRLLDTPMPFSPNNTPLYTLLVGSDGQIIARSSLLTGINPSFRDLPQWLAQMADVTGSFVTEQAWLQDEQTLVGYAQSQGHLSFKGFGWRVLVLQPATNALLPMRNLWLMILLFLALTLLLALAASFWMSAKIARPIVQLARFTDDFNCGKSVIPPTIKSSNEINDLGAQFTLMIGNLEKSRQDLVRAAKLAVIGEMAASMAHEVRTPLGILRSSAQMLQREPGLTAIGQEMAGFILSETQRLNSLVTMLLECAKPRPAQFARHNLAAIVEHALDLVQTQADSKNVVFAWQTPCLSADIECDRDYLIQVFLNLLMNAIQHVGLGGHIWLAIAATADGIQASVSDDGPGIADVCKASVFEPFFTQRQGGIGLGLTVVQQIVLSHQGRIFVTDHPGGGASFHVVLPLRQSQGGA